MITACADGHNIRPFGHFACVNVVVSHSHHGAVSLQTNGMISACDEGIPNSHLIPKCKTPGFGVQVITGFAKCHCCLDYLSILLENLCLSIARLFESCLALVGFSLAVPIVTQFLERNNGLPVITILHQRNCFTVFNLGRDHAKPQKTQDNNDTYRDQSNQSIPLFS